MSDNDSTEKTLFGCALSAWAIFVTVPMWLVLLFSILHALGDATPVYAWVLFWCYVPANMLTVIASAIFKAAK